MCVYIYIYILGGMELNRYMTIMSLISETQLFQYFEVPQGMKVVL